MARFGKLDPLETKYLAGIESRYNNYHRHALLTVVLYSPSFDCLSVGPLTR